MIDNQVKFCNSFIGFPGDALKTLFINGLIGDTQLMVRRNNFLGVAELVESAVTIICVLLWLQTILGA